MKRLVLEADVDQLGQFVGDSIEQVEYLEVVNFLKEDRNEVALICKAKFKDPSSSIKSLAWDPNDEVQVLDSGKDGTVTFYYRGKPDRNSPKLWKTGGYISTPYEIRDDRVRITFLGDSKNIQAFLSYIKKLGIKYKIDLLTDAKFSPDSPLGRLTEKQRKVLLTAFNLGYYDIPRRIGSTQLASKLGIRNPTFVAHRRKAERAILEEVIQEA